MFCVISFTFHIGLRGIASVFRLENVGLEKLNYLTQGIVANTCSRDTVLCKSPYIEDELFTILNHLDIFQKRNICC